MDQEENQRWKEAANARADEHGIVFTAQHKGVIPPEEREWELPEEPPVQRTEVKIHKLVIVPHPNADALEMAVVGGLVEEEDGIPVNVTGGFRAVVPKGRYQTGDYALYIPEASVLPQELIEELGVGNYLSGPEKNRVRATRLRGELSQGIVCRPRDAAYHMEGSPYLDPDEEALSYDYAEQLGITKWMPRVPSQMQGRIKARGTSRIVPWIEIPNVKKIMRDFQPGEDVIATEKIHGTHMMVTLDLDAPDVADQLLVASKGIGKQGWDLVEDEANVYWRAVRKFHLEEWLRTFAEYFDITEGRIALYGEVYGPGIQDLTYGNDLGYCAFDLRYGDTPHGYGWMPQWLFYMQVKTLHRHYGNYLPLTPVLYQGPYDYDLLCGLAEGMTTLGPVQHIREGIVVRPSGERRHGDGSRVIAKFINPAYLTRKGEATEYE